MSSSVLTKLVPVVAFVGLSSCDSAFSPKGEYREQAVVYSILSTRSSTQYVRVYTTYNPEGFDPYANKTDVQVRNAQVSVLSSSLRYDFRDTTINRFDDSRYKDPMGVYYAPSFPVVRGKRYDLHVGVPSLGNLSATLTVPGSGTLNVTNSYVLREPERFRENIFVSITTSALSWGLIVRFLLEYEVAHGNSWSPRRVEVPSMLQPSKENVTGFVYPKLRRRSPGSTADGTELVSFSNAAYRALLTELLKTHGSGGIRIKKAVFVMTQVEKNLYNYFNIANGFQDEFSIRTDLPDYSNIEGGRGIFGAMVDDSISVDVQFSL